MQGVEMFRCSTLWNFFQSIIFDIIMPSVSKLCSGRTAHLNHIAHMTLITCFTTVIVTPIPNFNGLR